MTLHDDLIAARELINEPNKWCKGVADDQNCAMWALNKTVGTFGRRRNDAELALLNALPRNRLRDLPEWQHPVVGFNDHPDTTHADVMALFDRAISRSAKAALVRGAVL